MILRSLDKRRNTAMRVKISSGLLVLLGLMAMIGFGGCGDAGGRAKTVNPVRIYVTDIANQMFQSDVMTAEGIYPDANVFTLKNVPLSPEEDPATSHLMDVIITGYEVKYVRKDTGVDVPKTFTGGCNYYLAVNEEVDCNVIFCRADQKEMPPLSYLWQFGYEPSTGLKIIHTTCTVTFWGRTNAGREIVSDPARFTVEFANWADD
jgi:hypothetical protein